MRMDNSRNRAIRGSQQSVRDLAKDKRQTSTEAESAMWHILRGRQIAGLKFRRQHPIGRYILDFYCSEMKLSIEIDGESHIDRAEDDSVRTNILSAYKIDELRFTNAMVLNDPHTVIAHIEAYVAHSTKLE